MISRTPRTPEAARKHGYKGAVRLAFVVDTSGKAEVSTVIVLAASDQLMRDWACGYVSEIRFTPATHEGRLVRTQVVVPFSFCATVVQERLPKNPPPCVVALP
jgi:outer membrane biosynthesis protein TonB